MALLENHYYHKSITLMVGVFGSVFNDMKIVRADGKTIKVPIAYAPGQKYNERLDERPDLDTIQYRKRTPRMAFRLVGWSRDISRIKNKRLKLDNRDRVDLTTADPSFQYNRVPYKFNFSLEITTKYLDDMLQIVEQILAAFNPSIQVVVNDNPDLGKESTFKISMEDSQMEDQFEGSFEESRELTTTFNFSLDGYIYQQTNDSSIIRTVKVDYFDFTDPQLIDQAIYTEDDL
jgi:hypothetical protein